MPKLTIGRIVRYVPNDSDDPIPAIVSKVNDDGSAVLTALPPMALPFGVSDCVASWPPERGKWHWSPDSIWMDKNGKSSKAKKLKAEPKAEPTPAA